MSIFSYIEFMSKVSFFTFVEIHVFIVFFKQHEKLFKLTLYTFMFKRDWTRSVSNSMKTLFTFHVGSKILFDLVKMPKFQRKEQSGLSY